jgi:hypothetical protein
MYKDSNYFFDYDSIVYEEFMKNALDYRTRHHLKTKKQCAYKCTFKSGEVKTYYPDSDSRGESYQDAPNYERSFFHKLNASGIDSCITDALTKIEKVNL